MREKLVEEYGIGYMEFISGMRKCPALKYTNAEYMEFYKTACEVANLLKKQGKTFDTKWRILMRNEVNETLGIYPEEFCRYEHTWSNQ